VVREVVIKRAAAQLDAETSDDYDTAAAISSSQRLTSVSPASFEARVVAQDVNESIVL
jgi:hypothetical protein